MLRIVQLNKYYQPHTGGVETVVQNIAEGLRACTDMRVLVCNENAKTVEEDVNGVSVRRSGRLCKAGPMSISFRYLHDVKEALGSADALLLHMPFPWGDMALRFSGYRGKVLLWWHSDIVRQKAMLKLYKPLMNWTLARADAIIVSTQGHINGSSFLQPYAAKCHIIPFGVEDEYYADGAAYLTRKTEKPKGDPVRFLFIGRMIYYKGCDILLNAFSRMQNKNCVLTMVGEGELLPSLQKTAEELGLEERVVFTGGIPRETLKKCIEESDVFVLPSIARSEAFALVQIEAMAYGKPVINTRLPSGVPYVSLDGVTGLTVEPGDADAFARAMDKMADDGQMKEVYGQNARRRVESEYRMETMMTRLQNLMETLCIKE